MRFKKIIGKIHLVLGLTSGLVVVIVALTGCIYAFQAEIQNMTQPYRFTEQTSGTKLIPSQLKEIACKELPGKLIHSVEYGGPGKAARISFYHGDPDQYYYVMYIDPYSGKVLHTKDMKWDFFSFILDGHFYLWLPDKIGQQVVAYGTLIFVIMLITGIILWWPKNKAARKQRFSVKWSARWRRKNYDLHNVLGFYASWIVIIISITGLVWGFEWFSRYYYWAISGGKELIKYSEPMSDTTRLSEHPVFAVDKVWDIMRTEHPDAASIEVHFPEEKSACIAAHANPELTTYWKTDYRYFEQHTLKELPVDHMWGRFKNAGKAERLMRMNYDIHVGAIFGLTGKFLAFFASLIVASLPITGFMIWYGRRKSSKVKSKEKEQVALKEEPELIEA